TWAGAVEQLEKLRLVPVYVRSNGETEKGLEALQRMGALPWPNPGTPESLVEALSVQVQRKGGTSDQEQLSFSVRQELERAHEEEPGAQPGASLSLSKNVAAPATPAEELFAKVKGLLAQM